MSSQEESILIQIGDVIREIGGDFNEGEICVVTQLEPVNASTVVEEDKKRLNPWRTGSVSGRLAILGHWEIEEVYRAILEGYEGSKVLEKEGFKEELLERLQADFDRGPVLYQASERQ
jgi:hypothetical protein